MSRTKSMSPEICQIVHSNIPEYVLYEIFKRLKHARDVFRFESVCKLWKSISTQARSEPQLGLKLSPMLFSPTDKDVFSYRIFSNSTPGWLLSCKPHSYNSAHLLNPLTGSYVPLPPLFNIIKAVASGSPFDPSCVVLAITGSQTLEFCNLCEGTWRKVENEIYGCSDIVYCNKKFYVLDGMGEVLFCDLRSKLEVVSPCTDCTWDKLLVELSGDLLQVIRRQSKSLFEVLKLDFNARSWIAVTSLGDHSLLWTDNKCLSVSSKDFPQFKSDCIYFVDHGGCILRTFDLKSKRCNTVHKLSETLSLRYLWFTPDVTIRHPMSQYSRIQQESTHLLNYLM